jgi:chromate transporter
LLSDYRAPSSAWPKIGAVGRPPEPRQQVSALVVAAVLAKVGILAFGGPAAHVALMRREIVIRRRWVDEATFLRMFAACNLIPGPSSTELAIYLGYRLAGWPGLALGGAFFIAPAMLIMLALAWLYAGYGSTPIVAAVLYGIRPVVVGIIAWAALDLGRRSARRMSALAIVAAVTVSSLLGLNPILLLLLGGVALFLIQMGGSLSQSGGSLVALAPWLPAILDSTRAGRLPTLFFTFLKLGAVSFGSGYVLFPLLQADFVEGLHWLPRAQLVDAIAIGQVTPGPVFTTATFLGYLFAGVPGALLATLGIFLPGFVLVPLLDRIVTAMERRAGVRTFFDGVNAAVVGLIAAVVLQLGVISIHDALTVGLAVLAFAVVLWKPLAAPAAVAVGGLAGLLLRFVI